MKSGIHWMREEINNLCSDTTTSKYIRTREKLKKLQRFSATEHDLRLPTACNCDD